MPVAERSRYATAGRSREETLVDQERLHHVLERALVFADRGGERLEPDRPAPEALDDRAHHESIEAIEPGPIDVEPLEREARELGVHGLAAPLPHLREVAHAAQQPIGDAWRAARPTR